MDLNYSVLKTRHREVRDNFPQALALRTHRALSWLQRAEQEVEDGDARFIFLWIAFNAAYANEIHPLCQDSCRLPDPGSFRETGGGKRRTCPVIPRNVEHR